MMHRPRRPLFFALLIATLAGLAFDNCETWGNGLLGGGSPTLQPGPFSYDIEFLATVQHGDDDYHGRVTITLDRPISSVGFGTFGQEVCSGNDETDWDDDWLFSNFGSVNIAKGGGYAGDVWDCLFGPHLLTWGFYATLNNTDADPVHADQIDYCDLNEVPGCIGFEGDP